MIDRKFRVWDKVRGKFTHDYEVWILGNGSMWMRNTWGEAVLLDDTDVHVQFFTGLKDKNNVDIYDGDIVRDADSIADGMVIWGQWKRGDTVQYGWWVAPAKEYPSPLFDGWKNLEVIGNVYQNPELAQ